MGLPIAGETGTIAEVEALSNALRVTPRGVDYGTLGTYAKALRNGASPMAAALAGASPIAAFRYAGAARCLVKRIRFSASGTATAFAAGTASFDFFMARAWNANYTGGVAATLTGNNGKLRTDSGTTAIGDFRVATTAALTPGGTPTLDAEPFAALSIAISTAASLQIVGANTAIWEPRPGEHPIELVNNEGWIAQATVPATGTWNFAMSVEYDEVPLTW